MSEVTQADREVAWGIRGIAYLTADRDEWMSGRYDNAAEVKALATHREEAARNARREAMEAVTLCLLFGGTNEWSKGHNAGVDKARAAILALGESQS